MYEVTNEINSIDGLVEKNQFPGLLGQQTLYLDYCGNLGQREAMFTRHREFNDPERLDHFAYNKIIHETLQ